MCCTKFRIVILYLTLWPHPPLWRWMVCSWDSFLCFLHRGNLLPNITAEDIQKCHFHPLKQPFCPILRLGDIVKFAGQNFTSLARTVRMPVARWPYWNSNQYLGFVYLPGNLFSYPLLAIGIAQGSWKVIIRLKLQDGWNSKILVSNLYGNLAV